MITAFDFLFGKKRITDSSRVDKGIYAIFPGKVRIYSTYSGSVAIQFWGNYYQYKGKAWRFLNKGKDKEWKAMDATISKGEALQLAEAIIKRWGGK